MSLKPNPEDVVSSDDDSYGDASPTENEKFVDDFIAKQMNEVTIQNDGDTKTDIEKDNESKPDRDDEEEKFGDCQDDVIDEEGQKELERGLTDDQKKENQEKAEALKSQGNEYFKNENYTKAVEVYTAALMICPVENCTAERAILYGNRAAAKIQLNAKSPAIEDCTKALEFNPNYMKALVRRAKLYEETDKFDESLEDYKTIQKLDPNNPEASHAIIRLSTKINERNEKLKEEMLGKLKDLGNIILKPFGLSTNNFQVQQDPSTGSYSVNFNQNA